MKILYDPKLIFDLSNANLFFDTNTFLGALRYEKIFGDLFKKLKVQKCTFLTIPSVSFEFTRGSNSITSFNERVKFIQDYTDAIIPIERYVDKLETLIIVLQRIAGTIHYTDFLLCACLYRFPRSFLITENHKDIPTEIFDRKYVITIDTNEQLRNYGIYKFSKDKYNKAAGNILKTKK